MSLNDLIEQMHNPPVIIYEGTKKTKKLVAMAQPLIEAGRAVVESPPDPDREIWVPYGAHLGCERGHNNMEWAIEHELERLEEPAERSV